MTTTFLILSQLESILGKQFLFNIGTTKKLACNGNGLGILFCAKNTCGFNAFEIKINGKDLYDVTLMTIGKFTIKSQETINDLDVNQMTEIISEATANKCIQDYIPSWR
jgi:hypothetical protein